MRYEIYAPQSYWDASQEERDVICNGCGSSLSKFDFIPDTIYGLSVALACHIHDWMYYFGKTQKDKEEADRVLRNNLFRIIENRGGWLRMLRRRRIWKYYHAVDIWGGPAYWANKNPRNTVNDLQTIGVV